MNVLNVLLLSLKLRSQIKESEKSQGIPNRVKAFDSILANLIQSKSFNTCEEYQRAPELGGKFFLASFFKRKSPTGNLLDLVLNSKEGKLKVPISRRSKLGKSRLKIGDLSSLLLCKKRKSASYTAKQTKKGALNSFRKVIYSTNSNQLKVKLRPSSSAKLISSSREIEQRYRKRKHFLVDFKLKDSFYRDGFFSGSLLQMMNHYLVTAQVSNYSDVRGRKVALLRQMRKYLNLGTIGSGTFESYPKTRKPQFLFQNSKEQVEAVKREKFGKLNILSLNSSVESTVESKTSDFTPVNAEKFSYDGNPVASNGKLEDNGTLVNEKNRHLLILNSKVKDLAQNTLIRNITVEVEKSSGYSSTFNDDQKAPLNFSLQNFWSRQTNVKLSEKKFAIVSSRNSGKLKVLDSVKLSFPPDKFPALERVVVDRREDSPVRLFSSVTFPQSLLSDTTTHYHTKTSDNADLSFHTLPPPSGSVVGHSFNQLSDSSQNLPESYEANPYYQGDSNGENREIWFSYLDRNVKLLAFLRGKVLNLNINVSDSLHIDSTTLKELVAVVENSGFVPGKIVIRQKRERYALFEEKVSEKLELKV